MNYGSVWTLALKQYKLPKLLFWCPLISIENLVKYVSYTLSHQLNLSYDVFFALKLKIVRQYEIKSSRTLFLRHNFRMQ